MAAGAAPAGALIVPPTTVDGPSSDILGFGGVAMAADGTGGLVYTKAVGGVPHVFACRYDGARWSAPIRVDGDQPYDGDQPRIAAGEGGRLLVVWVTQVATVHNQIQRGLFSAALGPGAGGFGPSLLVDPSVGDGTGVDPSLSGVEPGRAIVAYRVVTNDFSIRSSTTAVQLRPGDVMADIRLARLSGDRWSRVGPINRNPDASMRPPGSANGPEVGTGGEGGAVVAWQEPDQTGVARIWVRRVFGTTTGPVLASSPTAWSGRPVTDDADAFSLDVTNLGQARVAMRVAGSPGGALGGPRIFLNTLPPAFSPTAGALTGAVLADGSGASPLPGALGVPSIAASDDGAAQGSIRLAFTAAGQARQMGVDDGGKVIAVAMPPGPGAAAAALAAVGPEGGGVVAWPSVDAQGRPSVAVRQDFPSGAAQTGLISGARSGPVSELSIGRAGTGDTLLAFRQGEAGRFEIVAERVSAPPGQVLGSRACRLGSPVPGAASLGSGAERGRRSRLRRSPRWAGGARGAEAATVQAAASPARQRHPSRSGPGYRWPRRAGPQSGGEASGRRPSPARRPGGGRRTKGWQALDPRRRAFAAGRGAVAGPRVRRARGQVLLWRWDAACSRAWRLPPHLRAGRPLRDRRQRPGQSRQPRHPATCGAGSMRMSWRSAASALVALLVAGLGAAPAGADFGPIQLISKSATEQADEAVAPAISAGGRYLAFQGTIGGLKGVFRKDLQTGEIAPVATGSAYVSGAPGADSNAPSISADGRYVSFTTNAALDSADDQGAESSDVYVADMGASSSSYELASALDGGSIGLAYSGSGGSVASGRSALSADGRKVVFVTTAPSNLTSGVGGSTPGTPTPAGQVVLRNLDTERTTLVSVQRDPQGAMTGSPVPGGAVTATSQPGQGVRPGAALSGDGTTVAWLGAHLPTQVALLDDEEQQIADDDSAGFPYNEPLWRRVADGPAPPTRRIIGGGDPLAPNCPPGGTLQNPACRGPFLGLQNTNHRFGGSGPLGWLNTPGTLDGVPQLSADGRTVALIGTPSEASNAFVVDMHGGLDRVQAVRQLTHEVPILDPVRINGLENIPLDGDLFDIGVSADGRRIAFATARQQFPQGPPNLIGGPPSAVGLTELYRVDLDSGTLELVTRGSGAEPSLGSGVAAQGAGASAPSFDAGGRILAFASRASNLVSGDANGADDVFALSELTTPEVPGVVAISSPPRLPAPRRRWRISASASSRPDGSIRIDAVVPGAGLLRANADAVVGSRLEVRRVAVARRRARADGLVSVDLKLTPRYRRLAHSRDGLEATVAVLFAGPRKKPLRDNLEVRFRARAGATSTKPLGGRR